MRNGVPRNTSMKTRSAHCSGGNGGRFISAIAKPTSMPSAPPALQQPIVTPKPLISDGR